MKQHSQGPGNGDRGLHGNLVALGHAVKCPYCGYVMAKMLVELTPDRHCPECEQGRIGDLLEASK